VNGAVDVTVVNCESWTAG